MHIITSNCGVYKVTCTFVFVFINGFMIYWLHNICISSTNTLVHFFSKDFGISRICATETLKVHGNSFLFAFILVFLRKCIICFHNHVSGIYACNERNFLTLFIIPYLKLQEILDFYRSKNRIGWIIRDTL